MRQLLRRLRGTLGNALVWASSWFLATFGLWTVLHVYGGVLPIPDPWRLILYISASSAASGFLTGAGFSAYLRAAYAGKTLDGIRASRVGIGGAATAGLIWAALTVSQRLLLGVPIVPLDLLIGTAWPTLLGGVTATASIRVAQHADRQLGSGDEGSRLEDGGTPSVASGSNV